MKRTLTFEFDDEENESYEIVSSALDFHYRVDNFTEWLRSKIKHGFDDHEKTLLKDYTGEDLAVLTLDVVRDKFWGCVRD